MAVMLYKKTSSFSTDPIHKKYFIISIHQGWATEANLSETGVQTAKARRLRQHAEDWLDVLKLQKSAEIK